MTLDKAKLALLVLGAVLLAELILIGVLAGVAGAQVWNGKLQKKE